MFIDLDEIYILHQYQQARQFDNYRVIFKDLIKNELHIEYSSFLTFIG